MSKLTFDDVYDRAHNRWLENMDWTAEQFLEQLSDKEKVVAHFGWLNGEVCGGGFSLWVENNYLAHSMVFLLETLEKMKQSRSVIRLHAILSDVYEKHDQVEAAQTAWEYETEYPDDEWQNQPIEVFYGEVDEYCSEYYNGLGNRIKTAVEKHINQ